MDRCLYTRVCSCACVKSYSDQMEELSPASRRDDLANNKRMAHEEGMRSALAFAGLRAQGDKLPLLLHFLWLPSSIAP